jgi:hypothetical protein
MPALVSSTGATARHVERLARIEAEPPGPRRDVVTNLVVRTSRNEEPGDFGALIDAIGPERIAAAFPGGVPAVEPDPGVRSRARSWKEPAGYVCRIGAMLREQVAREAVIP